MNARVNWVGMAEVSRCKHDSFLVENLGRRNDRTLGGEKYHLCESRTHQVNLQGTAIPALEGCPAKVHIVDLDSLSGDVLHQALQKLFLGLAFIERGINEVDSQDADGFLL